VRRTDAETAQALRPTLTWMRTTFSIVPLSIGVRNDDEPHDLGHELAQVANTFGTPYRRPTSTSAGRPPTPATPSEATTSSRARPWS
jgi:hypothetical protein